MTLTLKLLFDIELEVDSVLLVHGFGKLFSKFFLPTIK